MIFCENFKEKQFDLRYYDNFHNIEEKDKGDHGVVELLIEQLEGSSVILVFAMGRIIIHVGLFGKYLGNINFSADVERFPVFEDSYRVGHVLLCRDKKLYRDSFFKSVYKLNKHLKLFEIDDNQIEL